MKRYLRPAIGLVLAALFAWLVVRHVDVAEVARQLGSVSPGWVLAALGGLFVGYTLRIARWRRMLAVDAPSLSWRACAGPFLASFALNNVLPLRAGDVLRTFAFKQQLGCGPTVVLATLLVERLLDLLMVLVLLGVALLAFGLEASALAHVGGVALVLAALGIMLLLLFPTAFAPLARGVVALLGRVAPGPAGKIGAEVDKLFGTLGHLSYGRTMLQLLALSLAAWLAEGLVFWCAALALSGITVAAGGWLALPVGTLATLIPSTPGYVGTFDFFVARAMTLAGNDAVAATAHALLTHLLLWLPVTVAGGLYLLVTRVRVPKESLS
ncbi:lysylphosphatidylglycerol synthase transmembrane domain-containing protein [Chitinibacteraceae bacterium HSL-7]